MARRIPIIFMLLLLLLLNMSASAQETDWVVDLLPSADDPASVQNLLDQVQAGLRANALLLHETFDETTGLQQAQDDSTSAELRDGVFAFRETLPNTVVWLQHDVVYDNVLIEIETEQLTVEDNNGFGLMCRTQQDDSGNAYFLLISGDGFASIAITRDGELEYVVNWERSPDIATGQAVNHMAALCYEDTIALFINHTLALSYTDDTYQQGTTGVAVAIYEQDSAVEMTFDNLRVWEVGSLDAAPLADLEAVGVETGDLLLYEPFATADSWEAFRDSEDGVTLEVDDGGYYRARSAAGDGFVNWGLSPKTYGDVVVQVETRNIGHPNNGYGLTCRSTAMNDSSGYYMMISADGFYKILRSQDREFSDMLEWTESPAINQQGENTITAVCVGDLFAVYANGVLLDSVTDANLIAEQGFVGVTVTGFEDPGTAVEVHFDDYRIWEASSP